MGVLPSRMPSCALARPSICSLRVEPICRVLQVAPSTYYAAVRRPLSARHQHDERLKLEISRVHRDNFGVYGIEKVWHQLNREGTRVGRDRVARLMDELDLEGVVRGKRKRLTTWPAELHTRPADLVERNSRGQSVERNSRGQSRGQSGRVIPSRRASTQLRAIQCGRVMATTIRVRLDHGLRAPWRLALCPVAALLPPIAPLLADAREHGYKPDTCRRPVFGPSKG